MKKFTIITALGLMPLTALIAQTKIKDGTITSGATPNTNAILDLESNTRGLLLPRLTLRQRDYIYRPSEGLIIFNTTDSCINQYDGGKWVSLCDGPWWNNANNKPSTNIDDQIYHLGSVNIGTGTTTGRYSLNVGTNNNLFANNSMQVGNDNTTDTSNRYINNSIILGSNNIDSSGSFIFGEGNIAETRTQYSAIFGYNNKAIYNNYVGSGYSFTSGVDNTNGSSRGTVMGYGNYVEGGEYNMAFGGYHRITNGSSFHNFLGGYGNQIDNGSDNIVLGYGNTLTVAGENTIFGHSNLKIGGGHSTIFGENNIDSSAYNFITGNNNIATRNMENATIIGYFNQPMPGALFTVGNGTRSDQRSNAFVVTSNRTSGGTVIYSAQLPTYSNEAAADNDANLPQGAFYKLNGNRAIFQKP